MRSQHTGSGSSFSSVQMGKGGGLASIREQREVWGGVSPERFYDNNDMPGRAHWMAVATHEPHPHSFQSLHFRVT